jgi:Zn-dependent alcohol dehydrogenase
MIGASLLAGESAQTGESSNRDAPVIIAIDVSPDALTKAKSLGATHTVLVPPNQGRKRKSEKDDETCAGGLCEKPIETTQPFFTSVIRIDTL